MCAELFTRNNALAWQTVWELLIPSIWNVKQNASRNAEFTLDKKSTYRRRSN